MESTYKKAADGMVTITPRGDLMDQETALQIGKRANKHRSSGLTMPVMI